MAETIKMTLDSNPGMLAELEVDGIVIVQDELQTEPQESIRCLDWNLNHQLRRAKSPRSELPVFIPTMNKIRASFVVLSAEKQDKKQIEQNLLNIGIKSVAILSESGKISKAWESWSDTNFERIVLCEGNANVKGTKS